MDFLRNQELLLVIQYLTCAREIAATGQKTLCGLFLDPANHAFASCETIAIFDNNLSSNELQEENGLS